MRPDDINDFYDLFDRPQAEHTPPPAPVDTGGVIPLENGKAARYAAARLKGIAEEVANTPQGVRHDVLYTAGLKAGSLVAHGLITREQAEHALTQASIANGHLADDGPREIHTAIRDGINNAIANPRLPAALTQPAPNGHHPAPPPPAGVTVDQGTGELHDPQANWVAENLPRINWHDLWADTSEEEWIIEPLLPARRLVALYSAPKVGKSLLMLELAVAIATGRPTLGVRLDRPRRVLYIDFENDPKGDIRERLQAMGHHPHDLDRLVYLSYPRLSALDSERGSHELLAAVHHYQCEVVVIDTISRAVAGEENENDTWLNFYRHSGVRLKADGIACIRLDHTGKDAEKGMRGGSAKYGDVDAVWRMTKLTDTSYRLDCTDHRMPITEPTLVVHRELVPHLHHRVDAEGKAATWRIKVDAVVDALDKLGQPNDLGRRLAREALKGTGVRASQEVVSEALKIRQNRPGHVSGNPADTSPPTHVSAPGADTSGHTEV